MKLRVVFEASLHAQGLPSLIDYTDEVEKSQAEILQVPICFRRYPIAFNSDIKKAFLQIEIQEPD